MGEDPKPADDDDDDDGVWVAVGEDRGCDDDDVVAYTLPSKRIADKDRNKKSCSLVGTFSWVNAWRTGTRDNMVTGNDDGGVDDDADDEGGVTDDDIESW